MASARGDLSKPMPWCIPKVFPRGEYYITFRPCYCGNEMILIPIPMYPAPSPWPACYYPPTSCLTKADCQCRECAPNIERPPFYPEDIYTVKSDTVLPEYPTYPEVQPEATAKTRPRRRRRRVKAELEEVEKTNEKPYLSSENLDR
ncbi:uncharacterized protein LOC107038122 [Diachasma alloeum]|uniref:uncharacterized protein LOC107038122 n=1 Tax=Diachasma alloeum TaxID=454923 RepID=UPI0007383AAD|nr:uncharacterized protein LOC107038122 [Diachasma alloeum]